MVAVEGMELGQTHEHPIRLTDQQRRRHIYISGKTGTGKTTLMHNMMVSDLEAGRTFIFLDPHGDEAVNIATQIPNTAISDSIYYDPLDEYVIGFNPLDVNDEHSIIAAQIISAFKHIWADTWGARMEYILLNTIRLLLVKNVSLIHLPVVLSDTKYRRSLLKKCNDPFVRYFWEHEYANWPERFKLEALSPVQNKIGQFVSNPYLRDTLALKDTLKLKDKINQRTYVICNLSKAMGEEPSHLLGSFLVTNIAQAAEKRAYIPENERQDITLYVDEFQNFATHTFDTILSEARKYRLNLVIANQYIGQLPERLRESVFGNVSTLISFRVGAHDAVLLAPEFDLPASALSNVANFNAYVTQVQQGVPSSAALMSIPPPQTTGYDNFTDVLSRTRANYARDREQVHRKIAKLFDA